LLPPARTDCHRRLALRDYCTLQKYGKNFESLESRERQSVGGTVGGEHRKQQMAEVSLTTI
jgi:hypothetical protein